MSEHAATIGGPDPATRSLWGQRPFRMLSYSRFFSRVAQNALNFGLVLLIVDETGRAFYSSLLVLALVVPATFSGILAGTLADVIPKRLLILFGDLTRAGVCLFFVLGDSSTAMLFVVAAGLSIFGQFASSAEGPAIPALCKRDELARANAISNAVGGLAQVIGFAVVAPLALRLFDSPDTLFVIAAILYITAGVQAVMIGKIRRIPVDQQVGGSEDRGRWYTAGWRQMRSDHRVWHAAVELTLMSMTLIILGGVIPSFIQEELDLPIEIGALVMLPAAVGVALGLRIAGFLAHRVPHTVLSTTGFAGFVVALAGMAFVNEIASFLEGYSALSWLDGFDWGGIDGGALIAMILVGPAGFFYALVMVAGQTVINDIVPLNLQGRVQSTQGAMGAVAASFPVLAAGALGDWIGIQPVIAILAAAIGVAAIANIRGASRARRELKRQARAASR